MWLDFKGPYDKREMGLSCRRNKKYIRTKSDAASSKDRIQSRTQAAEAGPLFRRTKHKIMQPANPGYKLAKSFRKYVKEWGKA